MSSTFVGDPRDRAFERLYERYLNEVYRYVLAMVRNPADAEDVTQTTFLNAYRALQAGAKPRAPHNWLIAIAHNTCRSSVRRAMRRPQEVPLGEAALAVPEPERPNVRELVRALGRLPSNQRSALAMRELEGRTYPEIAEKLGVTIPAVEALIARARRTLRTRVGTLRGLTAFLAPRSLRKLWENGEAAAGGALGAGVVAKAAAVVLVGIAGFASVEAGAPREARTTRPVPVRQEAALSFSVAPSRLALAARARALPPRPRRARAAPSAGVGRPAARSHQQTAAVAAPAAAPAQTAPATSAGTPTAPASAQAQDPVAGAVQQTTEAAVATVAASVPQAPPVGTPDLPAAPAPALPVGTPELPIALPPPPASVPPPPPLP